MKKVYSAGGVVFYKDSILLLKKNNGDWVLPKGKIESGESKNETALREVGEEAGVEGQILDYIGNINYKFKNVWSQYKLIEKNVYWFMMTAENTSCKPQKEEGFVVAQYIPMEKALKQAKYIDERKIIKKAISIYKEKYLKEDKA